MNDYGFPWANGLLVIALLVALLAVAATLRRPTYRCDVCGESFREFGQLLAHDDELGPVCKCGPRAHHPSCRLRTPAGGAL